MEHQSSPEPTPESYLELLEICWELRSPLGRVMICSIVRDEAPGFDVRAAYYGSAVMRSDRATDIESAHALAATMREALYRFGYVDVPGKPRRTQHPGN